MNTVTAFFTLIYFGLLCTEGKVADKDGGNYYNEPSDVSRLGDFEIYSENNESFAYISMDRRILSKLDNYVKATKNENEAGIFRLQKANGGNGKHYIVNVDRKTGKKLKYIYTSEARECSDNFYILATRNEPEEKSLKDRKKFEFEVIEVGRNFMIRSGQFINGKPYYLGISDCKALIGNHHMIAGKESSISRCARKFRLKNVQGKM